MKKKRNDFFANPILGNANLDNFFLFFATLQTFHFFVGINLKLYIIYKNQPFLADFKHFLQNLMSNIEFLQKIARIILL